MSLAPENLSLPSSLESERAVLAAVILDGRNLDVVLSIVKPEDFYAERHKCLLAAMLELRRRDTPIDERTLQAALEERGELDATGGLGYIAGLEVDLPDLARVEHYARIVRERALRRRLIEVAWEAIRNAGSDMPAEEALAAAEAAVLDIGLTSTHRGLRSFRDGVGATLDRLAQRKDSGVLGVSCGFVDMDRSVGGMLVGGSLVVVAGRPGMGKTTFALNVAQHVALRERRTVAVFSLEMSEEELHLRALSSEAHVPFQRLRTGQLSAGQWGKIMSSIQAADGSRLLIDDSSDPSPMEIASKLRRIKAEGDLAACVIDYLQLLNMPGRHENRNLEIGAITRFLKKLAKELDIPIVALSQLNRNSENRGGEDKRPKLSDLRESGNIEQDSDLVIGLYRDEVYFPDAGDNKGLAEAIVLKNRNGETPTVSLAFIGEEVRFASLTTQADPRAPGLIGAGHDDFLPFCVD